MSAESGRIKSPQFATRSMSNCSESPSSWTVTSLFCKNVFTRYLVLVEWTVRSGIPPNSANRSFAFGTYSASPRSTIENNVAKRLRTLSLCRSTAAASFGSGGVTSVKSAIAVILFPRNRQLCKPFLWKAEGKSERAGCPTRSLPRVQSKGGDRGAGLSHSNPRSSAPISGKKAPLLRAGLSR